MSSFKYLVDLSRIRFDVESSASLGFLLRNLYVSAPIAFKTTTNCVFNGGLLRGGCALRGLAYTLNIEPTATHGSLRRFLPKSCTNDMNTLSVSNSPTSMSFISSSVPTAAFGSSSSCHIY